MTIAVAFTSLLVMAFHLRAQENTQDESEEISWYVIPLWLPDIIMGFKTEGGITAEADILFGVGNIRVGGLKQSIDGKIFFVERGRAYYRLGNNNLALVEIDQYLYSDQRFGLGLVYEIELADRIEAGLRVRIENLTFWHRPRSKTLPDDLYYPKLTITEGFQVVPGLQVTVDRRDSDVDTFEGWYGQAYLEGTHKSIGSTEGFLSTGLDWRQFFKLGDNQTIGYNLVGRYGAGLPFYEEYRAGGSKSLRGFPYDRYVGDLELQANSEYRYYLPFPILEYSILDRTISHRLGFVLFADAGRAWDGELGTKFPNDVAWDVGFGLRLTLDTPEPLAVLRADFAVSPENIKSTTSLLTLSIPTFLIPLVDTSHRF
jgi:outer membrane protein assembly factor BamA